MIDILAEATAIVESVVRAANLEVRATFLARIAALLENYPDGLMAFIISDAAPPDAQAIEIATNAAVPGVNWLFWVGRCAIVPGEPNGE